MPAACSHCLRLLPLWSFEWAASPQRARMRLILVGLVTVTKLMECPSSFPRSGLRLPQGCGKLLCRLLTSTRTRHVSMQGAIGFVMRYCLVRVSREGTHIH